MKNNLKKLTIYLFFSLFLISIFYIFNKHSHSYATTNISSNSDNIKNIISSYFNSLQKLEAPNYDNLIVENNNTRLYSAMNELQVEQNKKEELIVIKMQG